MRINPTDPDLRTIYTRIKDGSLDLQPDFQRAEVWQLPKKKLLIDTILRGWQVPPVHVIWDNINSIQEVLDGQQRLSAIRDFMEDRFKVNGLIEPIDEEIKSLNGFIYSDLPLSIRRRFDRYAIRIFEIVEYNQGEPGELFYRLNESLKLTSAEKRNAYVGQLRNQMKSLVKELENNNLDSKFLGFSNQRLSYHDLFIKLCYMLESKNLVVSYNEKQLNDRARNDVKFPEETILALKEAIVILGEIKKILYERNQSINITKATLTSWLFFISDRCLENSKCKEDPKFEIEIFKKSFIQFETERYKFIKNYEVKSRKFFDKITMYELFSVFNSRSTSRVTSPLSLIIRDLIISIYYVINGGNLYRFSSIKTVHLEYIFSELKDNSHNSFTNLIESTAEKLLEGINYG